MVIAHLVTNYFFVLEYLDVFDDSMFATRWAKKYVQFCRIAPHCTYKMKSSTCSHGYHDTNLEPQKDKEQQGAILSMAV